MAKEAKKSGKKNLPKAFVAFGKRHGEVAGAYEALASACHEAGPLTERERSLVKLAIAVGMRHEGAVHAQVRKGLETGIEPEAMRHVALLALTTMGFPNMMAALTWMDDLLPEAEKAPRTKKKGKR
jgi:4-carboxymuconolactone decarboxylase